MGTAGRRIQEAAARGAPIWLEGEEIPVRASIETLRGLSAHADRGELESWLSHIPQVKRVALHHGEQSAQHDLVDFLKSGRDAVTAHHQHDDHGSNHAGTASDDDVGNVGQD